MKKTFTLLFSILTSIVALNAQEYLPKWEKGMFDIHTIATGKGENTFLVFPDGTTLLIDCGDMTGETWTDWNGKAVPDSSKTPAQWVARYIEHFSGKKEIDYFLLTHFHSDHFGNKASMKESRHGYGLSGVMELGEYVHFDKFIDRDYPNYNFPKDFRKEKGSVPDYIKFVEWQVANNNSSAEKFVIGSRKQVGLLHEPKSYDFEVWNVAANGDITTGKGTKTRKMYTYDDPSKFDENMFSTVQVYRYGNFRYYNGGDVPGGQYLDSVTAFSRNLESTVGDVINHHVDVLKANHHGCPDSCNSYFLWKMQPNAILYHCFAGNHPHRNAVLRAIDPILPGSKLLFPTQETGHGRMKELMAELQPAGHIVVRAYEGGSTYQIFVLDSKSTDYRIISKTEVFESGTIKKLF